MKIAELRGLLKDSRVMEEIHRHLWIESQKAGYNIGIEKATDEWLQLYSEAWLKYHMPEKYSQLNKNGKKKSPAKKAVKRTVKPKVRTKKKS